MPSIPGPTSICSALTRWQVEQAKPVAVIWLKSVSPFAGSDSATRTANGSDSSTAASSATASSSAAAVSSVASASSATASSSAAAASSVASTSSAAVSSPSVEATSSAEVSGAGSAAVSSSSRRPQAASSNARTTDKTRIVRNPFIYPSLVAM